MTSDFNLSSMRGYRIDFETLVKSSRLTMKTISLNANTVDKKWVVVEENVLAGGMGSLLLEFLSDNSLHNDVKRLGLPDRIIPHGDKGNQIIDAGLSVNSITEATIAHFKRARRLSIRKLGVSKVN